MPKRSRLAKKGSKPRSMRMPKVNKGNLVDYIMEYESGTMHVKDQVEMFAYLVKTGQAWSLQGSLYGRPAQSLIDAGILDKKGNINQKKLDEMLEAY